MLVSPVCSLRLDASASSDLGVELLRLAGGALTEVTPTSIMSGAPDLGSMKIWGDRLHDEIENRRLPVPTLSPTEIDEQKALGAALEGIQDDPTMSMLAQQLADGFSKHTENQVSLLTSGKTEEVKALSRTAMAKMNSTFNELLRLSSDRARQALKGLKGINLEEQFTFIAPFFSFGVMDGKGPSFQYRFRYDLNCKIGGGLCTTTYEDAYQWVIKYDDYTFWAVCYDQFDWAKPGIGFKIPFKKSGPRPDVYGVGFGFYFEVRFPYKPFGGPTLQRPGALHAANIGFSWSAPFGQPVKKNSIGFCNWNTIEFEEKDDVPGYDQGVVGLTIAPSWGTELKNFTAPTSMNIEFLPVIRKKNKHHYVPLGRDPLLVTAWEPELPLR